MALLEAANNRREGVDTIYRIDVDANTLIAQIKATNLIFKNAIESGNMTVSIREPTKSLVAALIIQATDLKMTFYQFNSSIHTLRESFGHVPTEMDVANGEIALSLEQYEPSAFTKQITYIVSELPS